MSRTAARVELHPDRFRKSLAAIVLGTFCMGTATAQTLSISGTVTDEKKAVVAGVKVILRDPAGTPMEKSTDAAGEFQFDSLRSGTYEISFSKEDYQGTTRTLTLTDQPRTVDVALEVGRITTTLDVTDSADINPMTRLYVSDMEVPAMTSVISQQTLREQNINDLSTALENVSGVVPQLQYGSMEWYTIGGQTQQSGNEFLFYDGMAMTGNRPNTQLTNIESVQVLKGPSSMILGNTGSGNGGAGGAINVTLKKPQAPALQEFLYRTGRWNQQEFAAASAGTVFGWDKLLYRVDLGTSYRKGWRQAGANRFNVSPSATYLFSQRGRVTVQESFLRDRYTMDAGLPLGLYNTPGFPEDRKFNREGDHDLYRIWQTQIRFDYDLGANIRLQNQYSYTKYREFYYHAEVQTYDPATFTVNRQDFTFASNRRPWTNNTSLIGSHSFLGMDHQWAVSFQYQDNYFWQERYGFTPGFTGSQFPIAALDLNAWLQPGFVDPEPVRTVFNRSAQQFTSRVSPRTAIQDHITVIKNRLVISLQGAYATARARSRTDIWDPATDTFVSRGADTTVGNPPRPALGNQYGLPYMVGITYFILPGMWEAYASTSSNFRTLTAIPNNLQPGLDPNDLKSPTSQAFNFGTKWRSSGGRLKVQVEAGKTVARDNLMQYIDESTGATYQAPIGRATTHRVDTDIEGYVGWGVRATAVYGYAACRQDTGAMAGRRCIYNTRHAGRAYLTKQFRVAENSRINASFGMAYRSKTPTNTAEPFSYFGGWSRFDAAIGYEFANKWSATINATNLFNRERYVVSRAGGGVYPGPPQALMLTLRYQFNHGL